MFNVNQKGTMTTPFDIIVEPGRYVPKEVEHIQYVDFIFISEYHHEFP